MKNSTSQKVQKQESDVSALRLSPIHKLLPINPNPISVEIDAIEIDPTNPGKVTQSLRDSRRAGSIRDSYDILSRIIYPIIVCQKEDDLLRFIHVDGYGRLKEAKARGDRQINAIVYPYMSLEQRICMRETLNAAQEPFDAVSIVHDLQELARIRNVDISDPEQVKTLVRDLPERVRKHEKDLLMLTRLHPNAVSAMGESYKKDGATIGLDKFRHIDRVLRTVEEKHPKTVERLGGAKELSLKISKMYLDKKFSEGTRSQDAIRRVTQVLDQLPRDDKKVADFFLNERPFADLGSVVEMPKPKPDIISFCRGLMDLLVEVDTDSLTRAEMRALERTESVLNKVLASPRT